MVSARGVGEGDKDSEEILIEAAFLRALLHNSIFIFRYFFAILS